MDQEAEKYRTEDVVNKQKSEAKNGLENYCYTMCSTLQEGILKAKREDGDKAKAPCRRHWTGSTRTR